MESWDPIFVVRELELVPEPPVVVVRLRENASKYFEVKLDERRLRWLAAQFRAGARMVEFPTTNGEPIRFRIDVDLETAGRLEWAATEIRRLNDQAAAALQSKVPKA